ncbi:MAG: hypothetical protein J6K20_07895 [Thermoguttaceae bacterium]|nr:hypothetical protein [Thermoguttaceae bacterium]
MKTTLETKNAAVPANSTLVLFAAVVEDVANEAQIEIGPACVFETTQTSEIWQGVEYDFALIPANSTDEPFIPTSGNYVLRGVVELATRKPIVFIYTFAAQ